MVHGEDFITVGTRDQAKWLQTELEKRFKVKTSVVSNGKDEAREARTLNRIIRITEDGREYEGDQRHGEIIVRTLSLDESKEVGTPGEESKPWKSEEKEEEKLPEPICEIIQGRGRTVELPSCGSDGHSIRGKGNLPRHVGPHCGGPAETEAPREILEMETQIGQRFCVAEEAGRVPTLFGFRLGRM